MTVRQRSANSSARRSPSAARSNWLNQNLTRVAASVAMAAAFACIPPATRIFAQTTQNAEANDAVDPDAIDALHKIGSEEENQTERISELYPDNPASNSSRIDTSTRRRYKS